MTHDKFRMSIFDANTKEKAQIYMNQFEQRFEAFQKKYKGKPRSASIYDLMKEKYRQWTEDVDFTELDDEYLAICNQLKQLIVDFENCIEEEGKMAIWEDFFEIIKESSDQSPSDMLETDYEELYSRGYFEEALQIKGLISRYKTARENKDKQEKTKILDDRDDIVIPIQEKLLSQENN